MVSLSEDNNIEELYCKGLAIAKIAEESGYSIHQIRRFIINNKLSARFGHLRKRKQRITGVGRSDRKLIIPQETLLVV